MNVFILTDLEGIAGVNDIEYMDRASEKYKIACAHLCHSINVAAEACLKAGAENVYYLDGHGGGGNADPAQIVTYVQKCTIEDWQKLLASGAIDCQVEIGCHARAGTINGFLDHTLSSKTVFCHKINDVEMSELALHAALCGKYGVPVVACTGDEIACLQAKSYIPTLCTGVVKYARCRNEAATVENADDILFRAVYDGVKDYRNATLFHVAEPAVVEVTYYRTDMCEAVYQRVRDNENVTRVDARTLRKAVAAFIDYFDLRI